MLFSSSDRINLFAESVDGLPNRDESDATNAVEGVAVKRWTHESDHSFVIVCY